MARAATAPELALFRTPGQWSKLRAAIFEPHVVYTARINQVFSTLDGVLELTYDTGTGTLADILPDMTLLIGSTAGAHDVGIVRLRDRDADTFFIAETSDVSFADNQYLTVIDDYGLWARHVLISAGVPYMDGGVGYSDQHANFDPTPIMGSNRVLKLEGVEVTTDFDASGSYVIDSTISAYAWDAPTSSSSSGMTTATPTIGFDTVGWHLVYLTLTAANSKSYFGVRYVYIWDDDNQPASAAIGDCRTDAETGGWSFDLTLFDNVTLADVRDHALVILFAEDHYGDTAGSIGPVEGCENILVTGWIAKESINWNPEQGQVRFTGYTAQFWLAAIPAYPDGVELVTGAPAAWTEMQGLTVRKGLYHFIHWRTTATRVMDVFLTDDTKYTKEVSSLAQNLWEQIREMAFLQIYARPGVNALNQLFVEVHPQLVPEADRDWPTVMTITKPDWEGEIDLERVTMNEVAAVSLSGVAVNASGVATAFFSLSAGHVFTHYGKPDIQDKLLVASQSQANTLCGMYFTWRNNPYPDIPITLSANNRLIDCFPRQKCAISIASGDTPRGIAYSGGLVPTSVAYVPDPETGYLHTEVAFEAETGLAADVIAANGDVPGSGDISIPPTPSFPPLPPFPIIIPGTTEPSAEGPTAALLHSTTYGLMYTADLNAASPVWSFINAGLTASQYQAINAVEVTPSGGIYVAAQGWDTLVGTTEVFIAYAASPGATFTIIEDKTSINAKHAGNEVAVKGLAVNPLTGTAAYVLQGANSGSSISTKLYIGSGTSFSAGAVPTGYTALNFIGSLSYGLGAWLLTGPGAATAGSWWKYASNGLSVTSFGAAPNSGLRQHVRGGTIEKVFHFETTAHEFYTSLNGASFVASGVSNFNTDGFWFNNIWGIDPTGMYMMARYDTTAKRGFSSDGGASWSTLPNLPAAANWRFRYAGSPSSWVAAGGGSYIQYTSDSGTTWTIKQGNLNLIAPSGPSSINLVRVLGY